MLYSTVDQLLCCILSCVDYDHDCVQDEDLKLFIQIFNQMIQQNTQIEVVYVEYSTVEHMELAKLFNRCEGFDRLYLKEQEKERIRYHLTSLKESLMSADPTLSVEDTENIIIKSIQLFQEQRLELKKKVKQKIKEFS